METGELLILNGPNRRSDKTVREQHIILNEVELEELSSRLIPLRNKILNILSDLGLSYIPRLAEHNLQQQNASTAFGQLFALTALALQTAAAHRVSEFGCLADSSGHGIWVWFEFEHDGVGEQAANLAFQMIMKLDPVMEWETKGAVTSNDLSELIQKFLDFARPLVLPLDTQAIIEAAERLEVPCIKLDREPFEVVLDDSRIRPNSMLQIGHCGYQLMVDGTLCVCRNSAVIPILRDRQALRQSLLTLDVPVPFQDPNSGNCIMVKRAVRAAGRISYPVVVKSGIKSPDNGVHLGLSTADEVRSAIEQVRMNSFHVIVEAMVTGDSYKVLVCNHIIQAVICKGQEYPIKTVHESISDLAIRISTDLELGVLMLDIVSIDISRPLAETGGAIVDMDLAPELDHILPAESRLFQQVANAFVRWLFPPGSPSRVPIVAVTGTNGKTTTCRMITRIMQVSGRYTGLVCTGGVYLDEQFEMNKAGPNNYIILENRKVDFIIFEEYFGHIARAGFEYSWSDVAVCTNVTPDHLGRIGVHTVEEIALLKQSVMERARHGVVLNADDKHCMAMRPFLKPRQLCLVSTVKSYQQLLAGEDDSSIACVLETEQGSEWIVLYDKKGRHPLVAVEDIPATWSGTAVHNVFNSMYAAAACWLSAANPETIRKGLSSFASSFEISRGRLNVFEGLPFSVIMDYAHNLDSFQRISEFVDRQQVTGRKIIMFAMTGDRQDKDIKDALDAIAGHYDHYVCRSYPGLRGRLRGEIDKLLETTLLQYGVPAEQITRCNDPAQAIQIALDLGKAGDLVLLLSTEKEFSTHWEILQSRKQQYVNETKSA